MTVVLHCHPVYSDALSRFFTRFHVSGTYLVMRHLAQLSLAVLLAASQIGPALSTAHAQQADNRVSLNFVDTDIPAVLRALSLFTQRNFLVDPRVKGKLTLVSDRPVDSGQALAMLTGALRLQGFAIVDVDGVTRVVPEADAKLQGSAVVGLSLIHI